MHQDPLQVLHAAARKTSAAARPRLVIAGATGALGNEAMRRLVGAGTYEGTQLLAREPITAGLRGVQVTVVPPGEPDGWPAGAADVAVVMFEPPRLFLDRERALWTPALGQLVPLARWLRASGVHTLAVVLPLSPGHLPQAFQRGLANLDEQAVAALGFERLLILRPAQKPAAPVHASTLARLAHWMLSISRYMVPNSEQPVRVSRVAQLLAVSLRIAPAGIHVAAPELVWQAAQGGVDEAARQWLA